MVLKYVGHINTDPVNDETGVDIWYGENQEDGDWDPVFGTGIEIDLHAGECVKDEVREN